MHKMSTKWTNSLQKVYYMYLCEIIRNSTMYKKHKKTQNTDPAFNSYLLLNGLKKNWKKKRSATSSWYTLKYKDA